MDVLMASDEIRVEHINEEEVIHFLDVLVDAEDVLEHNHFHH